MSVLCEVSTVQPRGNPTVIPGLIITLGRGCPWLCRWATRAQRRPKQPTGLSVPAMVSASMGCRCRGMSVVHRLHACWLPGSGGPACWLAVRPERGHAHAFTGNTEALRLWFDPSVISYDKILSIFFEVRGCRLPG
jgi:hypothetical protein